MWSTYLVSKPNINCNDLFDLQTLLASIPEELLHPETKEKELKDPPDMLNNELDNKDV